jgi:aerobic-type carbon monoxide dehydrogenase small subunit (CoxS/CutS family)
MDTKRISLTVNGKVYEREVETRVNLVDFLRHDLGLTGSHVGCEHGVCGACTVLVDGVSTRGCLMFAAQADGAQVETIEGLAKDGKLNPLQESFWDLHGLQCGYCTPGVLMSLTEMLRDDLSPTETHVREVLSGHLCRCTGYQNIVAAALEAAKRYRESGQPV